jgi:hypothetical protein
MVFKDFNLEKKRNERSIIDLHCAFSSSHIYQKNGIRKFPIFTFTATQHLI